MPQFGDIVPQLSELAIELPSGAFGNSGTPFKVFPQPELPRDPFEKIEDTAQVHKFTRRYSR
jgi:L-rhamnose isomerase/sugar isomerase